MKPKSGNAQQSSALPERIDGEYLLSLFACFMVLGATIYFWIWPLLKSLTLARIPE